MRTRLGSLLSSGRDPVILGSLSAATSLLGFVFQWFMITALGSGRQTDALFAGMVVPQLLLTISSGSLIYVLVPMFSVERNESFYDTFWALIYTVGILFAVLAIVLMFTANWWIPVIVPGFIVEQKHLAVKLVRIQALGIPFIALTSILWSASYAKQRYIRAETAPVISALAGLLMLIWGIPRYGITAAAWAMTVRGVTNCVLLFPNIDCFKKPTIQKDIIIGVWRKLYPLIAGSIYYKTDSLVERYLASSTPPGQLSILALARQFYDTGANVLNRALVSLAIPKMSAMASNKNWSAFELFIRKRRAVIMGVVGFSVLAVIIAGKSLISLVFLHRRFESSSAALLWQIMFIMAFMFAFGVINDFLASTFYSFGDTVTPTKWIAAVYTLSIILRFAMFFKFRIYGLAAASSIHAMILSIALFFKLRNAINLRKVDACVSA